MVSAILSAYPVAGQLMVTDTVFRDLIRDTTVRFVGLDAQSS